MLYAWPIEFMRELKLNPFPRHLPSSSPIGIPICFKPNTSFAILIAFTRRGYLQIASRDAVDIPRGTADEYLIFYPDS